MAGVLLAGCAMTDEQRPSTPASAAAAPSKSAAGDERPGPSPPVASEEEARALLAQAETDIHRARARRALWSRAWEALVGARATLARNDHAGAIRLARRASELAQLGLEQLAYPAVKLQASRSPP